MSGYFNSGFNMHHIALSPYGDPDAPRTLKDALKAYEAEREKPLDRGQKREFYDGWRKGELAYYLDNIHGWVKYMNKAQIAAAVVMLKPISDLIDRKMRGPDDTPEHKT